MLLTEEMVMQKVWLEKSYPPGVPHEIDADKYSSLVEVFNKYVGIYADRPAFINMGAEITFEQLEQQAQAFAAYLQQEFGLVKGDKFAIMVPNCLQYPSASRAGPGRSAKPGSPTFPL